MIVIGVTGTNSAGKDTVANILETRGFVSYSCSDVIREALARRGEEETRAQLIDVGNELRQKYGCGILAVRCLDKIVHEKLSRATVTSVRHPAEVDTLRGRGSFYLISVDAPIELRYGRKVERGRVGDVASLEVFVASERGEMSGSGTAQQLKRCIELADYSVYNDSSVSSLKDKVLGILDTIYGAAEIF